MNRVRATIWGLNLVIAGVLGYAAATTASLAIERSLYVEPQAANAVSAKRSPARTRKPLSAYREVLARNMFNADRTQAKKPKRNLPKPPKPQAAKPAPKPAPRPAVPLDLTLTGVFIAGDESYAMITGPKGGREQVYHVGQCVPRIDGVTSNDCSKEQGRLVKIELKRITVDKSGKPTPYDLAARKPSGKPATVKRPNRRARRRNLIASRERPKRREPRAPANAPQPPPNQFGEPEDTFPVSQFGNRYEYTVPNVEVEKAFENFTEIIRQARVVPIMENGKPLGFEIRKIRNGSIFQKLGLLNKDLIRSVNGQSLTNADQALRLFTVFRNEREIVLDISRGGEEVQLSYTVQ